jgi:hypothetical protein
MIDWFSRICDKGVSASCGIELDTSVGETERAGVYLQYRKHTDLVAPFLASIGEEARAESHLAVTDPTAPICRTLQEWGLADERWRLIAGAAFARHVPFDREDGSQGRFALCCMFNYTKVKFANAVAQPAKFYLRMSAGEVEA